MILSINNDIQANDVESTVLINNSQELSVHTVLSVFSDVAKATESAQKTLSSTQTDISSQQLEEAMILILKICQEIQISKSNLAKMLGQFSSDQAQATLSSGIAEGNKALDQIKQAIEKAKKAEEAKKAWGIFSWIITAITCVIAALTGCIALAVAVLALQVASSVQIDSKGDTLLSSFQDELEKVMPKWAAQLVTFVVILAITIACANPSEAVASEANAEAQNIAKQLLNKVLQIIKQYSGEIMNSAMYSGILPTAISDFIDAVVPSKDGDNDEIREILKSILTVIVMLLSIFMAVKAGEGFKNVESDSTLIDKIKAKLSGLGIDLSSSTDEIKNFLFKLQTVSTALATTGQASAGIAEGALQIEQGEALEKAASYKGLQAFLQGLQDSISAQSSADQAQYKDSMQMTTTMITKTLESFSVFESEAEALRA